jgi:hypothetical protein
MTDTPNITNGLEISRMVWAAPMHHGRLLAVVAGSVAAVILGGYEIARLIALAVATSLAGQGRPSEPALLRDRFFPCCSQCK